MPQITLYLDDATQALVEQAAQAKGPHEWPQNFLALAGAFADFPLREEDRTVLPADVLTLDGNTIS